MPLSVRWSTKSVAAIVVSQLPVLETTWPAKNRRKFRLVNERNVGARSRRWPDRRITRTAPA
jgi:hypothetical protein